MERRIGIKPHAEDHPHKPAILDPRGTLTYAQLFQRINRLANAFLAMGIRPDDKVSLLLDNSAKPLEAINALGRIGAVPVSINYRFKGQEILYIAAHSDSRAMVLDEAFLPAVAPIVDRLPQVRHWVLVRPSSWGSPPHPFLDYEELIASGVDGEPAGGPPDGVSSSLIYTSGTTGPPKGCFKSSRRRLSTLLHYMDLYHLVPEDVHLAVCPLYHAAPYAFSHMAVLLGNTLVIQNHFDPTETLRVMKAHAVTTTFMVPTQIHRIVNLPQEERDGLRPSTLRTLVVAAAPFPFPVKRKAVAFFGGEVMYEFYGATELSMNTLLTPGEQLRKPGSCGRAISGNDIRLLDEEGKPVPVGQVGELYVKNDHLLDGYYKMEEETARCFRDGYFTVGDLARVDEEGYYFIVDRKVDMVISGGVNIYPLEIELCLHRHPKVFDAAVIGVEDPDWGERLVAFIVARPGEVLTPEEVKGHVSAHLADYKKPREVFFVEELPYSAQGKLLKRELKARYKARQTPTQPGSP
jgi:acyl-CoA synthetase (AMP-forming)/AMP-acid ligase II